MRRVAAGFGLLACWAALSGCGLADLAGDEQVATVTVTAARASVDLTVPAEGYLEATQASPVAVPRVPTGALKVKDLAVEGSLVNAGDVVIVFDDTQLNIDLETHRASFRSADRRISGNDFRSAIESGAIEVLRDVAQIRLDNAEEFVIVDEDIYSRQEILESEVEKEEAVETIVFAEASLLLRGEYYDIEERILGVEQEQVSGKIDRVETSLGNLVLKTPISGMIVYKKDWRGSSVSVGDTLWPGNVVMSIVDPASAALTAFVLERDGAGLREGADADVLIDARPERVFEGHVDSVAEISRSIERGSPVKYFEVKVSIVGAEPGLLKPGMKGKARIETGRVDNLVTIPRTALRGGPEDPWVLVQGPSSTERRSVRLGEGDLVLVSIVEGLSEGERVVIRGDAPGPEPGRAPDAATTGAGSLAPGEGA